MILCFQDQDMETIELEIVVKTAKNGIINKLTYNPNCFFFVYVLACTSASSLWGYLPSIVTTLEKRFEVPTRKISSMYVIAEVSTLVLSLIISYLGGNKHRPRLMGLGLVISSISSLLIAIPQFLFGSKLYDDVNHKHSIGNETFVESNQLKNIISTNRNEICQEVPLTEQSAIALMLIGVSLFVGNGGYVLYVNLGTTFLDDNAAKRRIPMFLGRQVLCFNSLSVYLATVCLVKLCLTAVVNGLHHRACAADVFCPSEVWTMKLQHNENREPLNLTENKGPDRGFIKSIKEFLRRFMVMMKNGVLVFTCLAMAFSVFVTYGISLMMPKILETMFNMTASGSTLYTGYILLVSIALGHIIGGALTSYFKPAPQKLLAFMSVSFFMSALCCIAIVAVKCDATEIKKNIEFKSTSCETMRDCELFPFNPVCDEVNGITYYSECHANCQYFTSSGNSMASTTTIHITFHDKHTGWLYSTSVSCMKYYNCGCMVSDGGYQFNVTRNGKCTSRCHTQFLSYVILITVVCLLWSASTIIGILISLRCVEKSEKTFAQGLLLTLMTLIAFIPSPIIYGVLIDNSCSIWKNHNCGGSFCLHYNYNKFYDSIQYISAAGFAIAGIFSMVATYLSKGLQSLVNEEES
ncbi:Solute carrier organic anion transporter family member 2A1 [Nymphon striatum]|nr:Solute carrier organic anion transporter family member 2A1 [Nymphon striatum]